jgi:predicted GNAT family acetyltransferase
MDILQEQIGNKGAFYISINGSRKAEMTYVMSGADKMIIDHTEVSSDMEGKGIGKQLLDRAVGFARENKIKILPLCSFAKSMFEKTSNYNDVLF